MSEAWAPAATERARAARPAGASESLIGEPPLILVTQPSGGSSVRSALQGRASRPPASVGALFDPADDVGDVGLLEEPDFLIGHGYLERGHGVFEVIEVGGPDDRGGHAGSGEEPREGDPRGRDAALPPGLDHA